MHLRRVSSKNVCLHVAAMLIECLRSADESNVVKRVCTPLCTLRLFLISVVQLFTNILKVLSACTPSSDRLI